MLCARGDRVMWVSKVEWLNGLLTSLMIRFDIIIVVVVTIIISLP